VCLRVVACISTMVPAQRLTLVSVVPGTWDRTQAASCAAKPKRTPFWNAHKKSPNKLRAPMLAMAFVAIAAHGLAASTKLPLLKLPLSKLPLVGEKALLPLPSIAVLEEVVCATRQSGNIGLLMQASNKQVINWSPLLHIDDIHNGGIELRCVGRVSIRSLMVEPLVVTGGPVKVEQMFSALVAPYCDAPLNTEETRVLRSMLAETDELFGLFRERRDRVTLLRAQQQQLKSPAERHATNEQDDRRMAALAPARGPRRTDRGPPPLPPRVQGRLRAHGLDYEQLGVDDGEIAEQLLSSFAAFDRDVATWKTRVASMQCVDTKARVTLAQRAIKWTTRRLEAEISLRSASV
jgi:hypothetical protein